MFEKFKDASCLAFYSSYDRFMKNFLPHSEFFDFIRERFSRISNVDDACEQLNCIFYNYILGSEIKDNYRAFTIQKDFFDINKEIFDYCYEKHFGEKDSDKEKIRERILSDKNSFKLFNRIKDLQLKCKREKKYVHALEEFQFINAFSKFIHEKGNVENIDYFKRFLFIYPFEDKRPIAKKEWTNERQKYFDAIKKDKNADKNELKEARDWYKKQLETTDFKTLSEEEKSTLFKEMFVAFANISSEKTGGLKGYIIQVRNLLYLGRYYNIHHLPLSYIKWKNGDIHFQKKISRLAYYTWLSLCQIHPIFDLDKARKKKRELIPNMVIDFPIFGKKGKHLEVDEILKQDSYGEQIKEGDSFDFNNLITQLSLTKVEGFIKEKTPMEVALPVICEDMLQKSGLKELIDDKTRRVLNDYVEKMEIKDCSECLFSNFAVLNEFILKKPGVELLTHFDIHSLNIESGLNPKEYQELFENTLKRLL